MKQLFLDLDCSNFEILEILKSNQDYHYLCDVRRVKIGDEIVVIDKFANKFLTKIKNISKSKIELEVFKSLSTDKDYTKIDIIIAPIKAQIEDSLKMMIELGVDNIYFFNSENSIKKVSGDKLNRYEKIIKSAIEQSNTEKITKINCLKSLDDIPKTNEIVVLHHELFQNNIKVKDIDIKKNLTFIVGPEGGFSQNELDYFLKHDFKFLHLLKNILKSQTVPVAILSIINNAIYSQ